MPGEPAETLRAANPQHSAPRSDGGVGSVDFRFRRLELRRRVFLFTSGLSLALSFSLSPARCELLGKKIPARRKAC